MGGGKEKQEIEKAIETGAEGVKVRVCWPGGH